MKKIGIMTLYKNNINYGGMLQAYALQRAVQKLIGTEGECVQISYVISPTPVKEKIQHGLQYRSFRENMYILLTRLKKSFIKSKKVVDLTDRINMFEEFEANIPHTENIYTYKIVSACTLEFTHLITGSDQVWNGGVDLDAFCLGFAQNVTKKISYAASSGSTKFGKWQDRIFQKNLPTFTAISVREESVIPYFERMSGKKVSVVLDPVFLIATSEWHEIAQTPEITVPYIFCYLLGENAEQYQRAKKIAKENRCQIVTIPYLNGYNKSHDDFGDIQIRVAGPKEFLGLIENAKGIVTDSFHATAFSIIFNKPFLVLPRFENQDDCNKNHRITDILEQFGLIDCFGSSNEKFPILNYNDINKKMKMKVKESYAFLRAALENIDCE